MFQILYQKMDRSLGKLSFIGGNLRDDLEELRTLNY